MWYSSLRKTIQTIPAKRRFLIKKQTTKAKRRFLKIYTYDVVFRIGEANTNDISPTPIPYKKTNDQSQPQFP